MRLLIGGLVLATAMTGAAATAQEPEQASVVVILDANSIDKGPAPHAFPLELVNAAIAGAGVREELPYFAARGGQLVQLPGGDVNNNGWFALTAAPESWNTDSSSRDGLSNFVLAGPGVGSPDATGDRESQLRQVPGVTSLDATGLGMLVGRQVCGVIYDREVSVLAGNPTDLTGPTLGILAFKVTRLIEPTTITALPNVEVEIVEAHEVCHGPLIPFRGVPSPDGHE